MIFVPSRGRRAGLERFFNVCKPSVAGRVLIDDDDPSYDNMEVPDGWAFFRRPRDKTTRIINRAFEAYPTEDFYAVVGDDMLCSPHGWDLTLSRDAVPHYVAWGNDGRWGSKLCPSFFVGGELVRMTEWLVHPSFGHLYGDTIWWMIARGAGLARYHHDISVTHINVHDQTYHERQTRGDHDMFDIVRGGDIQRLIEKAYQFTLKDRGADAA